MIEIYQNLLYLTCASLIIWGLWKKERIFQFPFLMGAIFVIFLMPQIYSIINFPDYTLSKGMIENLLLVCCLCISMCWIGYRIKPRNTILTKLDIPLNDAKLLQIGLFYLFLGYLFIILIKNTSIQYAANGNWTGKATIYHFFSQIIYIAFAIFIFRFLNRPKLTNFFLLILVTLPILQTIFLDGRRQQTFTFFIIIGISFFLIRRITPPRLLVLLTILIGIFILPILGEMRGGFYNLLMTEDWVVISGEFLGSFDKLIKGEILELRNAAMLIYAADITGEFGFGTGFWDDIIFQYIPGQFVGYDFKESLQFKITDYNLTAISGYAIPVGSTYTGIGDSYIEFGYLGCLCFAFIAYVFKNLWIAAVEYKSLIAAFLLIGFTSPAMLALTHGIGRFIQEALFQFIFVYILASFAKEK